MSQVLESSLGHKDSALHTLMIVTLFRAVFIAPLLSTGLYSITSLLWNLCNT